MRIIHCGYEHWICVSGRLMNENTADACIFDSMARLRVDNHVGEQISRMLPSSIEERPEIFK